MPPRDVIATPFLSGVANLVEDISEALVAGLIADDEYEAFIERAYALLLGRAPDVVGCDYYLEQLYNGKTKRQVIRQLIRSSESRALQVESPSLKEAIAAWSKKNTTVADRLRGVMLFRRLKKFVRRYFGRNAQGVEHQIAALIEHNVRTNEKLVALETMLATIFDPAGVPQGSAMARDSRNSLKDLERQRIDQMSRQARLVYARLMQMKGQRQSPCE